MLGRFYQGLFPPSSDKQPGLIRLLTFLYILPALNLPRPMKGYETQVGKYGY